MPEQYHKYDHIMKNTLKYYIHLCNFFLSFLFLLKLQITSSYQSFMKVKTTTQSTTKLNLFSTKLTIRNNLINNFGNLPKMFMFSGSNSRKLTYRCSAADVDPTAIYKRGQGNTSLLFPQNTKSQSHLANKENSSQNAFYVQSIYKHCKSSPEISTILISLTRKLDCYKNGITKIPIY